MISPNQLYGELWAADQSGLEAELARSLHPRGLDSLYDELGRLGVGAEHVVLDAGARDAVHSVELVRRVGCRVVAVDLVPLHVERARKRIADEGLSDRIDVAEGALEALPFDDESFDYIWCRDVLNHVELGRALPECKRVLRPGGSMLVYQTFATEALEEADEAERFFASAATRAENMSPSFFEERARAAGLEIVRGEQLRGEWRERMLEDGSWDAVSDLLALSRLKRREPELVERFGRAAVEAERGGLLWGVYQVLGKTCPTIYVLARPRA
jgi:ubiquinone/menaquinone biosynthesis C-methylase UbiE